MRLLKYTLAIASILTISVVLYAHFTYAVQPGHPLMCQYKLPEQDGWKIQDTAFVYEGQVDRSTMLTDHESGECAVYEARWDWQSFCIDPTVIVMWNANEALKSACIHQESVQNVVSAKDKEHKEFYENYKPNDTLTLSKILVSF
jgi:hypothetical protein